MAIYYIPAALFYFDSTQGDAWGKQRGLARPSYIKDLDRGFCVNCATEISVTTVLVLELLSWCASTSTHLATAVQNLLVG